MKYRFVWFDLGLTLVKSPADAVYQLVLKNFGVQRDVEEIARAVYITDKEFMRRYPHVLGSEPQKFLPWYLGVLNFNLGIGLNLEEVYHEFVNVRQQIGLQWRLYPGAAELLADIKQRGVGVGLISNWDHTCRQVLNDNGIDLLLDEMVISSEIGVEKPNPEIFRHALKHANVSAEQSLYVGDNYYDDVVGAAQAGIRCLLLAPYGQAGMEEISHEFIISSLREVLDYIE